MRLWLPASTLPELYGKAPQETCFCVIFSLVSKSPEAWLRQVGSQALSNICLNPP